MKKVGRRPPPPDDGYNRHIVPLLKQLSEQYPLTYSESSRVAESNWPVFRLHHQRSKQIFNLFKSQTISEELWEWCMDEGIVDKFLVAKWKKPGWEGLCCLKCVEKVNGTVCVCRVPKRREQVVAAGAASVIQCQSCGCRGCASGDGYDYGEDLMKQ